MIKPIRPPYFFIFLVCVLILALLTGGAFWKIRRSPGFYEKRADKLVAMGDHLLASRQYAAAAEHTENMTNRARLITKRCEELTKTDRPSLEAEFKDYFKARSSLLDTVKTNPGSPLPIEVSLRFFYHWAEVSPGDTEWHDFKDLIVFIDKSKTGGPVLERYKAIARFRECLRDDTLNADTLAAVVKNLEARQPPPPYFDADAHFNLNLARIYLADALYQTQPGKAYSLRQQATAPPPGLAAGTVNTKGIANQAALMIISGILDRNRGNQSYAEVAVAALNTLDKAASPEARVSFAKQLLVSSLYPPLKQLGTGENTPTHTALKILNDLIETRQQETLSTWLLLTFVPTEDVHARTRSLLNTIRSRPNAEKGFLTRLVNFRLRMQASQSHIFDLLDNLGNQPGSEQYDDMLAEARDDVDFLASLELLRGQNEGSQSGALSAVIDRYALEKRRGVVQLRKIDRRFKEKNAFIKLQLGISLDDCGESGAALDQFKAAWNLKQQVSVENRLEICDWLCQTLIKTGHGKDAETMINSLVAVDRPPAAIWRIAGRTFRGLSTTSLGKAADTRDACLAKARSYLRRATLEEPRDYRNWLELGRLAFQNGDFKEAESTLQKALSIEPYNWSVERFYLNVLMARRRFPEAVKLIQGRLTQTTDSRIKQLVNTFIIPAETEPKGLLTAMNLLAPGSLAQRLALYDYYRRTDNPQATEVLRELETAAPNHERVVALEYNHQLKVKNDQAIDRLVDSVENPLTLRSLQHVIQGEYALYFQHPYAAINSFQEALKDDPWNSRTWMLLAGAQEEGMLPKNALTSWRRAGHLNPANPTVRRALSRLSHVAVTPQTIGNILAEETNEKPPDFATEKQILSNLMGPDRVEDLDSLGETPAPEDSMADLAIRQLAFKEWRAGKIKQAEKRLMELADTGLSFSKNHLAAAMLLAKTQNKQAAIGYVLKSFKPPPSPLSAMDSLEVGRVLNYLGAGDAAGPFFAAAVNTGKQGELGHRIASEYIRWLLARDNVETAVSQARALVTSQPPPAVLTRIGNLFAIHGLYQPALDLLANAPQSVSILGVIGGCRDALDDRKGAREAFTMATQLNAKDPRPYIWRAKLLEKMNTHDALQAAETEYKTAIALQPDLLLPRLEWIRLMERRGRYKDARKELVALVAMRPLREDFRLWQCENALSNNQPDAADSFINEAMKRGMTSPQWNYLAAKSAFYKGDSRQALHQMLIGISRFKSRPPFEFLVELLIRKPLIPEAESVLKHLPDTMNSARLEVFRARLADRQNQPDKCLAHLQSALKRLKDNPDDGARDWLRQVLTTHRIFLLEKKVEDPQQLLLLLQCAWDVGAYRDVTDLARELLRQTDKNDPNQTNIRLMLANAYQFDKQYRRAATVYEHLVNDLPTLRIAKNNLAYVYAVYLMKGKEAETLARSALADANVSAAMRLAFEDTLGMSLFTQEKYAEAVDTLGSAAKVSDNLGIQAHLALAIMKNGQPVEGRKRLLDLWRQAALSPLYSAQTAATILETMTLAGLKITSAEKLVLCEKHLKEKRYTRVRALMRELPPISEDADQALERAALMAHIGDGAGGRDLLHWARESDLPVTLKQSLATVLNPILPAESRKMRAYLETHSSTPAPVLISLGRRRMADNEFAQAEKIFARVIQSPSPPAEAVIGFLAARLRLSAPPPENWLSGIAGKARDSTGVKCLWAASQRDDKAVNEYIRYVNTDPAIQASDILAAGYFLLNREIPNYDLLEALAAQAVAMTPASAAPWMFRAVLAEDQGKAENAFNDLARAVRNDPLNTGAISVLGLKLAAQNRGGELAKLLNTYALLYQDEAWFSVLKGEAARLRGDWEKAAAAFRGAFQLDASPDTLFRLAQSLLDADQATEVAATLARNNAITQTSGPLLALWAKAAWITGDCEAALKRNARALRTSGKRDLEQVVAITAATCPADSLPKQFQIFREQKVSSPRQEAFIRLALKDPENRCPDRLGKLYAGSPPGSTDRRVLGLLLTQTLPPGSPAQAKLFTTLMTNYPQFPLVFERVADAILKAGDPKLAVKANSAAMTAVDLAEKSEPPDNHKLADCLATLARSQVAMTLIDPAYRNILRSIKLDPNPENIFLAAEILVKKGDWMVAEKELNRVEKLLPGNGDSISSRDIEALRKRIKNRDKEPPVEP